MQLAPLMKGRRNCPESAPGGAMHEHVETPSPKRQPLHAGAMCTLIAQENTPAAWHQNCAAQNTSGMVQNGTHLSRRPATLQTLALLADRPPLRQVLGPIPQPINLFKTELTALSNPIALPESIFACAIQKPRRAQGSQQASHNMSETRTPRRAEAPEAKQELETGTFTIAGCFWEHVRQRMF